jgi:hypothetical protein
MCDPAVWCGGVWSTSGCGWGVPGKRTPGLILDPPAWTWKCLTILVFVSLCPQFSFFDRRLVNGAVTIKSLLFFRSQLRPYQQLPFLFDICQSVSWLSFQILSNDASVDRFELSRFCVSLFPLVAEVSISKYTPTRCLPHISLSTIEFPPVRDSGHQHKL